MQLIAAIIVATVMIAFVVQALIFAFGIGKIIEKEKQDEPTAPHRKR